MTTGMCVFDEGWREERKRFARTGGLWDLDTKAVIESLGIAPTRAQLRSKAGHEVNVCLRYENEIPIRFCSVHTGLDRIPTVASTLNGWANLGAVIAVGDFNTEPDDPVMDKMYKSDNDDSLGRGLFYEADIRGAEDRLRLCRLRAF
jgi:hypothetical protein